MAFTLKIKARALLGPKKTDIDALLRSCGMAYGNTNEFYILEEGKSNQGTAVLYNPKKLGRGIFMDFSENEKGSTGICALHEPCRTGNNGGIETISKFSVTKKGGLGVSISNATLYISYVYL